MTDASSGSGGPDPQAPQPDRRAVLGWLGLSIPCGIAAYAGLRPALQAGPVDQPGRIPLCRLKDVGPAGGVRVQPVAWTVRQGATTQQQIQAVFLERLEDGSIRALSGRCPHTGCRVEVAPEDGAPPEGEARTSPGYLCRCHNARFSGSGEVLQGPPPRGLDVLPLEIPDDEEGQIVWVREGQAS